MADWRDLVMSMTQGAAEAPSGLPRTSIDMTPVNRGGLSAYRPTMRDRLAEALMGEGRPSVERSRFVEGLTGSRGMGATGMGVVDATPFGVPLALNEAGKSGDVNEAALAIVPGAKPLSGMAARTGIRGYHASPHDFDRFDMSKVGTGQGAQSYGHGMYIAESPAVSSRGGQYDREFTAKRLGKYDLNQAEGRVLTMLGEGKSELDILRDMARNGASFDEASAILESIKKNKSHIYEVNINARPEQFLDWDKPLGQQSNIVQQAISQHPLAGRLQGNDVVRGQLTAPTGEAIVGRAGRGQEGTQSLREAGIPGIKYLDQGSRGLNTSPEVIAGLRASIEKKEAAHKANPWLVDADKNAWGARNLEALEEEKRQLAQALGGPTSNYVVFDDKLIDILKKYGLFGGGLMGLGVAAQQEGAQ